MILDSSRNNLIIPMQILFCPLDSQLLKCLPATVPEWRICYIVLLLRRWLEAHASFANLPYRYGSDSYKLNSGLGLQSSTLSQGGESDGDFIGLKDYISNPIATQNQLHLTAEH